MRSRLASATQEQRARWVEWARTDLEREISEDFPLVRRVTPRSLLLKILFERYSPNERADHLRARFEFLNHGPNSYLPQDLPETQLQRAHELFSEVQSDIARVWRPNTDPIDPSTRNRECRRIMKSTFGRPAFTWSRNEYEFQTGFGDYILTVDLDTRRQPGGTLSYFNDVLTSEGDQTILGGISLFRWLGLGPTLWTPTDAEDCARCAEMILELTEHAKSGILFALEGAPPNAPAV